MNENKMYKSNKWSGIVFRGLFQEEEKIKNSKRKYKRNKSEREETQRNRNELQRFFSSSFKL